VAKPAKTDRKAVIEEMRKKQKSADRRRGTVIVSVCVLVAVGLIAAAAVPILLDKWNDRELDGTALKDIGAAASVCQKATTKKADGNQEHVPVNTPVDYADAPPAFGAHWNEAGVAPASFARKFYTADDRPALEALVHNLEHGYTILWYDQTVADDTEQMNQLRGIADKFSGTSNLRFKFKAVPWLESDGKAFPDGKHIAFTHWSIGGSDKDPSGDAQVGVWQFCSAVSGEALNDFMIRYPYLDAPEPGGA
jgi:hypothetical protein